MKNKQLIILLLIFIELFALISCNKNNSNTNSSNELKIVSLAPNVTEIICALDSENNLIGRTDYCNYPESVNSIQSIGDMYSPNIEMIVALHPDIVIASSIVSPDFIESLNQAGIKSYQFFHEYEGLEGLYTLIDEIGNVINKQNNADKLIQSLRNRQRNVENKVSNNLKTSALLITWGDWGDYAATGDTFLDDILRIAGAKNIASDCKSWAISKELLIKENPDYIFITDDSNYVSGNILDAFKTTKPYSDLNASLKDHVYVLQNDMTTRLSIRSIDTLELISKIINDN